MSNSIHKVITFFCVSMMAFLAGIVSGQDFDITGIGISGSRTGLDIEVRPGDSAFVVVSFEGDLLLRVTGVSLGEETLNQMGLFFYSALVPDSQSFMGTTTIGVDSTEVIVDTLSIPHTMKFGIRVPELSDNILSLQVRTGIYAINEFDEVVTSNVWVSHVTQGEDEAILNPVAAGYSTFLFVSHEIDNRPVIHYPANGDTIGRFVTIEYDQPMDAIPGTVTLQFAKTYVNFPTTYHTLFISNNQSGQDLLLELDLLYLNNSPQLDSIQGFSQLYHDSLYQIRMGYRLMDGRLSDSLFVDVRTDLQTNEANFLSPGLGVSSVYPDLPVLYRLNEPADTVVLIFEADTLSPVGDLLSPHILRLVPEANSLALHEFILDGTDIGWQHPLIESSNRGPLDSLKTQTIYNVTLEYGDRFGNLTRRNTNEGYIWPEDNQTIPPRIIHPGDYTADNRTFWFEIEIPETPLMGSVRLRFDALGSDPGSPHTIYLGSLSSAGSVGFYLNALALNNSNPPVTGVDGGNSLIDGLEYFTRVFYSDVRGNPEASTFRIVRFDDSTDPPVVYNPDPQDTLALSGVNVTFTQPENAIPGTVQIVLSQTGGEETDPFSPRILYLTDPLRATIENIKRVMIQPAFLTAGEGIDSVHNGGSLQPRATYEMIISYQDTLANAYGSTTIGDLYFPSGSTVTVRGYQYQLLIIPGNAGQQAFMLAVKAEGESSLRGVQFDVEGTVQPFDIDAARTYLWISSDSLFSPEQDTPVDTLDEWIGGPMVFDSLSVPLSSLEQYFLLTVSFTPGAVSSNSIDIVLWDKTSIDAGGDPVECVNCPIGIGDVALAAELLRFYTEQHTEFGSLKLIWDVASETDNEGFNVWRRTADQSAFSKTASFTDHPELYGRGTEASGHRYVYVDRRLTPGETYYYQLESVSISGFATTFYDSIAEGIPEFPPDNFILKNAYPNPFNPATTIEYIVPYVAEVRIRIFDLLGREVKELVRAQQSPAVYKVMWDGTNNLGQEVTSGVYFYQMEGGKVFNEIRKILLVR
ncbi:T9SS type A sorting domain-containing protein [bacterium]|nr:T9SS type A sorting domain-containing protein [bacterium]MBU1638541.1 T9SS type A sorting domain-containing protein [bacterium]MBU1919359.1 T9SS type A sorting domain-containing protein [bacterium]